MMLSTLIATAPHANFRTAPITDRFGRVFTYLRVAVNEACNLRCVYCMPPEGIALKPRDELLTAEEIARFIGLVAPLGVGKIRLTGGEPLLRRDIAAIVERAANTHGVQSVHLTTNGVLLRAKAAELRAAGLRGVNVSLDTLQPERFRQITRRDGVSDVLDGIRAALEAGFASVKINCVVMRGFNDDEIGAFARATHEWPVTVRFIELMPFDSHQIWKTGKFFSASKIVAAIREAVPDVTPDAGSSTEEHVFRAPGWPGRVAVIPAYTRSLCGACNRIRLTADGKIRNCLYAADETDVRALLRGGAADDVIVAALRTAMTAKKRDGWEAQKAAHGGDARGSMTQIGG